MRPAFTSVVRDDTDILPWCIRYYYNIGIRDFYLMLHCPTDLLFVTVDKIAQTYPDAKFRITIKNEDIHLHDADIKRLTDQARRDGCDWMIASDADEIILFKRHNTIQDFCAQYDNFNYVSLQFKWIEYVCDQDVPDNANPFTALKYREHNYRKETKTIAKLDDNSWFVPGLHFVMNSPKQIYIDDADAVCVHFPTRNKEQWIAKTKMHCVNFTRRYGSYPLGPQIAADPVNFLPKFFDDNVLKKNVDDYIFDPVRGELFA